MALIYVNLSVKNVDSAFLKVYGIRKAGEIEESKLNPKKCPRCHEMNQFTNTFCNKGGMILNKYLTDEKFQKDLERRNADLIPNKMISDPEFVDLFAKIMGLLSLELLNK